VKILQVVDFFKPFWSSGGITPVAYHIAQGLVEKGHEVTVYSNGDGRDTSVKVQKNRATTIDGMTVYYFRNVFPVLARDNLYTPYMLPFVVRRDLRTFDVIHVHSCRSTAVIPVWYYARKYNVPYVLQAHGMLETLFLKGTSKRIFDRLWGNRILRDAARVVALTPLEAKQYERRGIERDRIEVVPNGIDLSEFANLPSRGEFRRRYHLSDNENLVLYLGRIHMIKGLDILLKAFASLSTKQGGTRLVISGPDDGYLATLQRMIRQLNVADRVLLTGPLYGVEKQRAYVDADIYVLPSVYEPFGITLLEAMVCGTPVITTDRCGIADWVNNRGGYVVPYDSAALRHALEMMLSNESLRKEFGEQGRKLVLEHFTWAGTVEKIENLYEEALRSKTGAR
jgi:glycosyltransferase involved in cell wall biosynthesis